MDFSPYRYLGAIEHSRRFLHDLGVIPRVLVWVVLLAGLAMASLLFDGTLLLS